MKYPLSIRDVKPHPDAVRITGKRGDGMDDGFHTGGAYLYNGLVYKPLDGRPDPLADYHIDTHEEDALQALAGTPLFPKNWHIVALNERRFLVRKKATIFGTEEMPWDRMFIDQIIRVERGVMNMNRRGWCINDAISVGIDPDTQELFIVDMSIAGIVSPTYMADDMHHVSAMMKWTEIEELISLRDNARNALHNYVYLSKEFKDYDNRRKYKHVYASFIKPICELPGGGVEFVQNDNPLYKIGVPHTWVFTQEELGDPLDASQENPLNYYRLDWGYSRLH